ncbi:MAG: hypothetical protein ACXVBG_19515, partial [Isosphaeraceae bacterium]
MLLSIGRLFTEDLFPPTRTSPPFGRGPTLPKPVPALQSYRERPGIQATVLYFQHSGARLLPAVE